LPAETNCADTDFIHRRAIEFQPHDAEFGGIERGTGVFASHFKRGEGRAHGLENGFPILVVSCVVEHAQLCKFLLERRWDGDEAAYGSAGGRAVGGHEFYGEIRRFALFLLGLVLFFFLFLGLFLVFIVVFFLSGQRNVLVHRGDRKFERRVCR
jgi:hypothetical protein